MSKAIELADEVVVLWDNGLIDRDDLEECAAELRRLAAVEKQLEAAQAAWKKQCETLTHQVICCGVAASHSDPTLTMRGAYAGKWNSAQADSVRQLRKERDELKAELAACKSRYNASVGRADALRAELAAIRALEPVAHENANGVVRRAGYQWDAIEKLTALVALPEQK